MKRTKEILKSLLVVLFWAVATIDFLLVFGEDDGNMNLLKFTLIKAGAIAAAVGLYQLGKYAWNHGWVPQWYIRYTEALMKEE